LVWLGLAIGLGALALVGVQQLGDLLVPPFAARISLLALVLGGLAVLWSGLNLIVSAITSGGLALILVAFGERLGLSFAAVPTVANASPEGVGWITARRLALALVAGVVAAAVIGAALVRSVQLSDDVVVVGHRGAAASAPENTLAAVRAAITEGADWIEIDVQETADGEVVVIHDRDLMKIAGVDLNVWQATLADLAEIDVGSRFDPAFSAERVPTLRDVLDEAHGRAGVVIELKYYGHQDRLEARVAELVDQRGMADEVRVMSLERAGLEAMRALRPDWTLGLLAATALGNLTRVEADFLAVNTSLASAGFIRRAHDRGKQVWAWTVNDPLAMSRLISLGIDGLITDRPALAREVLRERAGLSPVERLLLQAAIVFDRPLAGPDRTDGVP
jgi:glycerophosphoryl diester phosphodiesterase